MAWNVWIDCLLKKKINSSCQYSLCCFHNNNIKKHIIQTTVLEKQPSLKKLSNCFSNDQSIYKVYADVTLAYTVESEPSVHDDLNDSPLTVTLRGMMWCATFSGYLWEFRWWCNCCTTQPITGSSLRFTMNDLIRHQQVCDRGREGEKRSVWFPHSCREEEWGMHQLQTMALYPAQWLTHKHTLTNKTQTHTYMHTHTSAQQHTHTNFSPLVFQLPSWTTTGSQRECVATLCVFVSVHKLLSSSKQNHHHSFFWTTLMCLEINVN